MVFRERERRDHPNRADQRRLPILALWAVERRERGGQPEPARERLEELGEGPADREVAVDAEPEHALGEPALDRRTELGLRRHQVRAGRGPPVAVEGVEQAGHVAVRQRQVVVEERPGRAHEVDQRGHVDVGHPRLEVCPQREQGARVRRPRQGVGQPTLVDGHRDQGGHLREPDEQRRAAVGDVVEQQLAQLGPRGEGHAPPRRDAHGREIVIGSEHGDGPPPATVCHGDHRRLEVACDGGADGRLKGRSAEVDAHGGAHAEHGQPGRRVG